MTLLTKDQVIQIVTILNESNFSQVHLEFDGFQITASKSNANITKIRSSAKGVNRAKKTLVETEAPADQNEEIVKGTESISSEQDSDTEEENLDKIKAPMLGTFYSAPDPESPPFVKVNDFVKR